MTQPGQRGAVLGADDDAAFVGHVRQHVGEHRFRGGQLGGRLATAWLGGGTKRLSRGRVPGPHGPVGAARDDGRAPVHLCRGQGP